MSKLIYTSAWVFSFKFAVYKSRAASEHQKHASDIAQTSLLVTFNIFKGLI